MRLCGRCGVLQRDEAHLAGDAIVCDNCGHPTRNVRVDFVNYVKEGSVRDEPEG